MAIGNAVSGGGTWSGYNWHSFMNAYIISQTATTATVRVDLGYETLYAIDVYANGRIDGGGTWSGSIQSGTNGSWKTTTVLTQDFTVAKGSGSAYTATYSGYVQATGGFGNGTSYVSVGVAVPSRDYSKPNPPRNFAATRVSDTQMRLSWAGDYTGMSGDRPWSGVLVDRADDGGARATVQKLSWDAVNYTDGSTSAGHRYDYSLRAQGPGGISDSTAAVTIYTTPTAPRQVTAAKTSASSVTLTSSGASGYWDSVEVQVTSDGGVTWRAASATSKANPDGSVRSDVATVPAGTVAYRVRLVKGGLYGPWAQSNSVVTVTPPLAPSVSLSSQVAALDGSVTVRWTPNHPDGSAQEKAEVQAVAPDGSVAGTAGVDGSKTSFELRNFGVVGGWKVRVRTKGLDASWGAWSGYVPLRVAVAPQAHFTSPASEGAEVTAMPLAVAWEVVDATGVSSQSLTIARSGGDARAIAVTRDSRSASVTGLENGAAYTLTLDVRGGSGLTVRATRTFATDWAQPAPAEGSVSYDDLMAAHVTVRFGNGAYSVEGTSLTGPIYEDGARLRMLGTVSVDGEDLVLADAPATVSVDAWRVLPDGTETLMATGLRSGQQFIDRLPPLNVAYRYRLLARAESGATAESFVEAYADSRGMAYLNWGVSAESAVAGGRNGRLSHKVSHGGTLYHFMDGQALPRRYGGREADSSIEYQFEVVGQDELDRWDDAAWASAEFWFRDQTGRRMRVAADISWDISHGEGELFGVKVSMDRLQWREPANG